VNVGREEKEPVEPRTVPTRSAKEMPQGSTGWCAKNRGGNVTGRKMLSKAAGRSGKRAELIVDYSNREISGDLKRAALWRRVG
jgi:hypothetical protein